MIEGRIFYKEILLVEINEIQTAIYRELNKSSGFQGGFFGRRFLEICELSGTGEH